MSHPLNILVVDDEPALIEVLVEKLSPLGPMNIVKAHDGIVAHNKSINEAFDLICLDYKLPKMMGKSLIVSIRETHLNAKTPILVCSAFIPEAEMVLNSMGPLEHLDYISKPYNDLELLKKARKLIVARKAEVFKENFKNKITKVKLDLGFVEYFLSAAIETMSGVCKAKDIEVVKSFEFKNGMTIPADISVAMEIQSPKMDSCVYLSFSKECILKSVNKMLDTEYSEINADISDAALELMNIVYSRAKGVFIENSIQIDKLTPSVLLNQGPTAPSVQKPTMLATQLKCDSGDFYVTVSLADKT
jgi:CheY-like chemotaxis protein/CheY-specific phosphatase CheX